MSSGIIGMQRLSRYLQAYGTIWESFYVIRNDWNAAVVSIFTAYVTIWESFYVIRNYWNAAFVSIFTSICKDMGVIVRHLEILECGVCLDIYKHM